MDVYRFTFKPEDFAQLAEVLAREICMAADYPPFMNATGVLSEILKKIKVATTPERFTPDFLSTNLGFATSSAKAFIPFAKRLGLLASDGRPTELYTRFRNPSGSGIAMAEAMKKGYSILYQRNEYAHKLNKKDLEGLITEVTGLENGHATVKAIRGSFNAVKSFANFDGQSKSTGVTVQQEQDFQKPLPAPTEDVSLNLSYTINLVLPRTDDVAVFNAIFQSLREHLLKK